MKISEKVLAVCEGAHYHTKIRSIDEQASIKRIRMGLRESARLMGNILNPDHPTPDPEGHVDAHILSECHAALGGMSERLSTVKTKKKSKKVSEDLSGKSASEFHKILKEENSSFKKAAKDIEALAMTIYEEDSAIGDVNSIAVEICKEILKLIKEDGIE